MNKGMNVGVIRLAGVIRLSFVQVLSKLWMAEEINGEWMNEVYSQRDPSRGIAEVQNIYSAT